MAISQADDVRPRSLRRWFRISLRSLLVLMTAVSVAMGYVCSSAKRQQHAVEALEALGVNLIEYDWRWDFTTNQWDRNPTTPRFVWLRKLIGPHYTDSVVYVSLRDVPWKNRAKRFDDFYPPMAELPALRILNVADFALSDADFATIGRLHGLETLYLTDMDIPASGAAKLASMTKLRELHLHDVTISGEAIGEFKKLPNLELFSLICRHTDFPPVNSTRWVPQKYSIGDDALPAFLEFPRLRRLYLVFTVITDDGMAKLSRIPRLEQLEVSSPRITNASIAHVTKLTNLDYLGLEACGVEGERIEELGMLPKLTRFRISGNELSNDSLVHLAALDHLKWLELSGKKIDDAGLQHLHRMTNLTFLDVQGTAVTTDGKAVKELQRALLNCSIHQYSPSISFR